MEDRSLPDTWTHVVTDPSDFYAKMPEVGGLAHPTAFLAACVAVDAAGHLLFGGGIRALIGVFVSEMVGVFILAAVAVLVAQHLFAGRAGFEPTFRALAYAAAPAVVFWIPIVGQFAIIYAAYLAIRGLEKVHALDTTRATLTLLLALLAVLIVRHHHHHGWHHHHRHPHVPPGAHHPPDAQ